MFNFFRKSPDNAVELQSIISEGAFLVDVRSAGEFLQGSVKGAINIPLDALSDNLDKFKNKKNIVVFCRSGTRSAAAKNILDKAGFLSVSNGGSWKNVQELLTT